MKEYICKEDLKGLNQYAYGVEEIIAEIPTVTKADICCDALRELRDRIESGAEPLLAIDVMMEEAEMEEEMKIILSKYIKDLKAYSEELEYLYVGMDKLSDEEIKSKLDIIADKYSELGIELF